MVDMNLPLPYAFNYHFDNGVFRGLAFANFTSPTETDQVINALNHMELSGRKLRVEYKKMLPLAERERIEREKRERRGQLEEQHRPVVNSQLHSQLSMGSMSRNTPSPLSQRAGNKPGLSSIPTHNQPLTKPDVDMNDPKTLEFYTDMMLFRRDTSREVLIFPPTLDPASRRIVHTLAHHMGLAHTSRGTGEQRQVHILRPAAGTNVSPPSASGGFPAPDGMRQNMARASTSDFGEGRAYEPMFNNNILRGQSSVGLLDVGDSNYGRNADNNLRNAKSFADLRSWSPSPVPSSASFPAALQTNGTRLQAQAQGLNDTAGSNTPTLTPTASSSGAGARDEPFLISGFSNLSMGNGSGNQTSPRRQRSLFGAGSWDDTQSYQPTAPIGSKRTVSIGPDSTTQDRVPMRQSRGPSSNNAIGFRRQNGRGSDELRTASSAIAE
jgi:R3H domain